MLKTVEHRLETLSQRIDEALKRPAQALDNRPIDELTRRLDGLKATLERQAETQPTNDRLEATLAEITRKLDRPHAIDSFDPRSIEALVYHVDTLRDAVERQTSLAPTGQKLEGVLVDIARKLETLAPGADSRQTAELARRIEALKEIIDRQAAAAPTARQIEAAVAEIGRKLDRPIPAPRIDLRPLEEIARQIESGSRSGISSRTLALRRSSRSRTRLPS